MESRRRFMPPTRLNVPTTPLRKLPTSSIELQVTWGSESMGRFEENMGGRSSVSARMSQNYFREGAIVARLPAMGSSSEVSPRIRVFRTDRGHHRKSWSPLRFCERKNRDLLSDAL